MCNDAQTGIELRTTKWRPTMCEQCGCGHDKAQETFETKVKMIIDSIRPNLQGHGGDVEFVSTENGSTVKVRLQGACSGCPGAKMTLKMGIGYSKKKSHRSKKSSPLTKNLAPRGFLPALRFVRHSASEVGSAAKESHKNSYSPSGNSVWRPWICGKNSLLC
jgi:Fe-S cluster biogenesis protein NfuA